MGRTGGELAAPLKGENLERIITKHSKVSKINPNKLRISSSKQQTWL
jgi:hypothetical protein